MSGLAVFFRHYVTISLDLNTATDPSSALQGSETETVAVTEEEARETRGTQESATGEADLTHADVYDQSLLQSQRSVLPNHADSNVSSFKEWRDEQCNLLQDYLVQRLFAPVGVEPNDEPDRPMEEEEEEETPNLETQVESTMLETQVEYLPPSQEDDAPLASQDVSRAPDSLLDPASQRRCIVPSAASNRSARRNSLIPNVSETYFLASHLSELDLYVQRCSLPVLEVTKVWHLRSTLERRRQRNHSSECFQYDGPLVTVYSSVLSLEVHQARKEINEELRRRTEQIHTVPRWLDETSATPEPQGCHMFFYDAYAKALNSIFNDTSTQHVAASRTSSTSQVEVYLSLDNIPAKCIFPYHSTGTERDHRWMRPADWFASYRTIPYCLCIGGASAVECQSQDMDDDDEDATEIQRIHFDANVEQEPSALSLAIRCWVVVFPLVTSALLTAAACPSLDDPETNPVANVQIPSTILEYEIGPGYPMRKRQFDSNSENDAVLIEMKEIWDHIEKHHRKKRVMAPVPAAPAVVPFFAVAPTVAPAAAAAAPVASEEGTSMPETIGARQMRWTTPQRMTGRPGVATPITGDALLHKDPSITTPVEDEPILAQLMTPGERMKRRRLDINLDFHYQKLSDLPDLLVNTEYSFYAAVLSYSQPYRTKRGDWIMSISLIDDSLPLCENELSNSAFVHSVTINIFVKPNERDRLPKVRYAGDVIRLSNIKLQMWKEERQLVSTRASTFVVLRRNGQTANDTNPEMYPPNDENVLLSDTEWEHMLDMWHWAQRRFLLHATMKIAHRFRLSDMRMPDSIEIERYSDESTRGDLTVLVASILPIPTEQLSGTTPRGFLRVWDGTGVPKSDILPIDTEQARESVKNGDPPTVCLIKISEILLKLQELRQNPDLQPPKALSGRVANVAIWEKQHWELVNEGIVSVGSFIRLRNVHDSLFMDKKFRCLHVHEKSSFTPLPNLTYEVAHLLEEHNNRLLRKEPINPDSGILPLNVGNIDQTMQETNDHGSLVEDSLPVDASTSATELRIQQRKASATSEEAPNASAPTTYRVLDHLLVAPMRSTFVGNVFVTSLYPGISLLSSHGIELICPQRTNGTGRFYRFGLELQQACQDSRIAVIVSDDRFIIDPLIGQNLFGFSATAALSNSAVAISNFQENMRKKSLWSVQISSIIRNGSKFFLLDSLKRT